MTTPVEGDGAAEPDEALDALITRADLDGLIRLIDARTASGDWPGLSRLRSRARFAINTGRQLWPAATLAEYRLSLLAPPAWACRAINDGGGRFAIGPLTEVVAQHHRWDELAPWLDPGPAAMLVAHERIIRGEILDPALTASFGPDPLELTLSLQSWEPVYPPVVYTDHGLQADPPTLPAAGDFRAMAPRRSVERLDDPAVEQAVRQLIEPWTAGSNGRAEVITVGGDADDAVGALGAPEQLGRLASLTPAEGLAWLAWAGASGGAHGRRRGGGVGRFGAWWMLAAIADATDAWPVDPGDLGAIAAELSWYWWEAGDPVGGWQLQLAIHDPIDGVAWAINARDQA